MTRRNENICPGEGGREAARSFTSSVITVGHCCAASTTAALFLELMVPDSIPTSLLTHSLTHPPRFIITMAEQIKQAVSSVLPGQSGNQAAWLDKESRHPLRVCLTSAMSVCAAIAKVDTGWSS